MKTKRKIAVFLAAAAVTAAVLALSGAELGGRPGAAELLGSTPYAYAMGQVLTPPAQVLINGPTTIYIPANGNKPNTYNYKAISVPNHGAYSATFTLTGATTSFINTDPNDLLTYVLTVPSTETATHFTLTATIDTVPSQQYIIYLEPPNNNNNSGGGGGTGGGGTGGGGTGGGGSTGGGGTGGGGAQSGIALGSQNIYITPPSAGLFSQNATSNVSAPGFNIYTYWYYLNQFGNWQSFSGTFASGAQYKATLQLQSQSNYYWETPLPSIRVYSQTASPQQLTTGVPTLYGGSGNPGNYLEFDVNFTYSTNTWGRTPIPYPAQVPLTAPAAGAWPQTSVSTGYYYGTVRWVDSGGFPVSGAFSANSYYTAQVTLTANPGYYWASYVNPVAVTGAQINNARQPLNTNSGDALYFEAYFGPAAPNGPYVNITFTAEQTGGISNALSSTGIQLVFSRGVYGLTDSRITITDGTGSAVKGALTPGSTNMTYTLNLANVAREGSVYVYIDNFWAPGMFNYNVTNSPQRVLVYKGPQGAVTYGDLNRDGAVNSADLILMCKYFANPLSGGSIDTSAADVNRDGAVNSADLILFKRYFSQPGVLLGR